MNQQKLSLEPAMKRLTEISVLMGNDGLSLDEALELYKEAAELADVCKAGLQQAQLSLQELIAGS